MATPPGTHDVVTQGQEMDEIQDFQGTQPPPPSPSPSPSPTSSTSSSPSSDSIPSRSSTPLPRPTSPWVSPLTFGMYATGDNTTGWTFTNSEKGIQPNSVPWITIRSPSLGDVFEVEEPQDPDFLMLPGYRADIRRGEVSLPPVWPPMEVSSERMTPPTTPRRASLNPFATSFTPGFEGNLRA